MKPATNIAISAARAAGNIILRHIERLDTLSVKTKQRNDFVSNVDHLAEQEIIDVIRRAYPDHGIVAEESGHINGNEYSWIIDPLDGTTNYLRGFPHYAVSIALQHKDHLEVGIIYDPFKEEMFCAEAGGGATLNNRRIRVSSLIHLEGALLGTGFPFREYQNIGSYLTTLESFMKVTAGIRRAGSASLDLAYVAAGRLDGFWEFGLHAWDIAAGCLLIQEAGGLVSDPRGGHTYLDSGNIVAANAKILKQMLVTLSNAKAN